MNELTIISVVVGTVGDKVISVTGVHSAHLAIRAVESENLPDLGANLKNFKDKIYDLEAY